MMPAVRAFPRALALAFGCLLVTSSTAAAAPSLTSVGSFTQPVLVTAPVGDPHRAFVVERSGTVRVVKDGTPLLEPFLDISGIDLRRTGLASVAFAPDYDASGLVYVLYSEAVDSNSFGVIVKLDQFKRSSTNPDMVDPASRQTVMSFDYTNTHDHDADHIAFGPDGLLYISLGEGLDDYNLAQDPNAVARGKILRIDPQPDGSYTIPPGNPFVSGGGAPEVFAYGLRNPWRFSFDWQNRQLIIADVGDGRAEEVDSLDIDTGGGANLGWPCWEGTLPHNTDGPCTTPPAQTEPVFEYNHDNDRCSIIGGYIGRDPEVPELFGRYVHGDFCTGEIRSLGLTDAGSGMTVPFYGLASFGEDGCGHLYVLHQSDLSEGNVWRIDGSKGFVPCFDPNPPPQPPQPPPSQEPPPSDNPPPPADTTPPPPAPAPVVPGQGTKRDRTPPRLSLTRARKQRVAHNRSVAFGALCSERCTLKASARFAGERSSGFLPASRKVAAGERVRLKLRLGQKALKGVRRLAGRGKRVRVRVDVTARDASGNKVTRTRYVVAVP
jgi:hypothetical protein